MKKTITLLVVLSLIIAAGAIMAQASGDTVYCERCNQDISKDNWQVWNFESGNVAGGHYRLTDDFFSQTNTIRIPEDTIVCLDLNGHTYSSSGFRMFNIAGTFTIMDSKGGGMILSTGQASTYGGCALVQSSGTLKLYGGTIRYSAVPGVNVYAGGLIYIDGGRMDVYNGATVAGGIAQALSSTYAQGGNIAVHNDGVLKIYGGTIKDGLALKSSSKTGQGGNIYASNGGKVVIRGGVVEGGYSDSGGGNIFIAGGTLEMTGGIIRNGHALVSGGNIMANAGTDVANSVTISGGSITGGVAGGTYGAYSNDTFDRGTKGGGNIYERSPAGALNIAGGTIDGDIVLDYAKTFTLSGAPQIGLGNSGGLIFTDLSTKLVANAEGLTDGAEIYVQASRVFTTAFNDPDTAQKAIGFFKGAVRTSVSVTDANALQGTQGNEGYCPHCQQIVTWKNLNADATFSGHSYLSASLVRTSNLSVSNSWVLDLNGYTLHQENRRFIFNYNSADLSLTILDSWGGGRVQVQATQKAACSTFGKTALLNCLAVLCVWQRL